MSSSHTTAAIIVAAGAGSRSGADGPKQFARVAGRPMLAHSHAALSAHPAIGTVLTVIGAGQEAMLADALGDVPFAIGGATRRQSVRNGLERLAAERPDRVLIHDAARPFLRPIVIDRLLSALDAGPGALPGLHVADTLVRGGETIDRDGLVRVQTPQAFAFDAILAAHRAWTGDEPTDDAQMLRASGHDVIIVPGDPMLDKLTYPEDFALAEARAGLVPRSAGGFDVHRLEDGEELWLGGVRVPHTQGLSGHSDADVALHAMTDALLGTIAAGDIGLHFPPSDPQWRGARSGQFLQHAAKLIRDRGGVIDFVDVTLMCEAPKIGPHREAMRASIAALLALPIGCVSVKATTTERLGFTGRGEGIAAQATASVRVPQVLA